MDKTKQLVADLSSASEFERLHLGLGRSRNGAAHHPRRQGEARGRATTCEDVQRALSAPK